MGRHGRRMGCQVWHLAVPLQCLAVPLQCLAAPRLRSPMMGIAYAIVCARPRAYMYLFCLF